MTQLVGVTVSIGWEHQVGNGTLKLFNNFSNHIIYHIHNFQTNPWYHTINLQIFYYFLSYSSKPSIRYLFDMEPLLICYQSWHWLETKKWDTHDPNFASIGVQEKQISIRLKAAHGLILVQCVRQLWKTRMIHIYRHKYIHAWKESWEKIYWAKLSNKKRCVLYMSLMHEKSMFKSFIH